MLQTEKRFAVEELVKPARNSFSSIPVESWILSKDCVRWSCSQRSKRCSWSCLASCWRSFLRKLSPEVTSPFQVVVHFSALLDEQTTPLPCYNSNVWYQLPLIWLCVWMERGFCRYSNRRSGYLRSKIVHAWASPNSIKENEYDNTDEMICFQVFLENARRRALPRCESLSTWICYEQPWNHLREDNIVGFFQQSVPLH